MHCSKCHIIVCAVLTLVMLAAAASTATAGEEPFGTGLVFVDAATQIETQCRITNVGTKEVTISAVDGYGIPGSVIPLTDCVTTLAPNETCFVNHTAGVYAGVIARVQDSTKYLRGYCRIATFPGGTGLFALEMR